MSPPAEIQAMIKNKVPNLLKERFGAKPNLMEVKRQTGLSYPTIHDWANDRLSRFDNNILDAWCKYFGVNVCDILEYIPDEE